MRSLGDTTSLTYVDKTANRGTTYTYTVRCVSADGRVFTSAYDAAGKSITIAYLATPALGSVTRVNGGVQITWGKVAGAAKYRVFRTLGDTTSLTYVDKTANRGTTYTYTVRCVSADGRAFTSAYDAAGKSIFVN